MKKKYIFFDIDGTLTDRSTGQIVPSAQKALNRLQEAGHFVAIATGRAHYKARPFMEKAGLKNMVCCGGGALVVDNELYHNIPLDRKKALTIIHQAEELGIGILLMLDDSVDCYAKNDLFREQVGERKEPTRYVIDPELDFDSVKEIYKIYLSVSKEDEEKLSSRTLLGNLRFVPEYLMFQYDEKRQGILDMLEVTGGNPEDVIVFGDDDNDLVMFNPQWLSIAMGNASSKLKEKAAYITAANVDDGIYKACEHFNLFEKTE